MGIIQIITDEPGQINVPNIRRVKVISTDNFATVTAAGYLNPTTLQGYFIYNTDIIDMWYGATASTNGVQSPGTYAEFYPSISNGIITLVEVVPPGGVTITGSTPTSGRVVTFSGANTIQDSGTALSALQLSANIKSATTANIGGGGAGPISVSVTGMTAASVVTASVATSTNAVAVSKVVAGSGSFNITFTEDPGATCTVNYVAFIVAQ